MSRTSVDTGNIERGWQDRFDLIKPGSMMVFIRFVAENRFRF